MALATPASAAARDTDRDRVPHSWEIAHGLNPRARGDAKGDPDRDGLSNLLEYLRGGDPRDEDTDNDGLERR